MKITTVYGKAWDNYLSTVCDIADYMLNEFISRIEIIDENKNVLLRTMLEDNPDMHSVQLCKEEIDFQRDEIAPIIEKFVEYCNVNNILAGLLPSSKEILISLCCEGTNDYLYKIASGKRK